MSLKNLPRWYFDLKLGYISDNIELFSSFSMRNFHPPRRYSYGLLRKHPRLDVGVIANFGRNISDARQLVLATCYKPNSWSFLKFGLTNDMMFSWNYGFTLVNGEFADQSSRMCLLGFTCRFRIFVFVVGFTAIMGFSSNLKNREPCLRYNVSVNINV